MSRLPEEVRSELEHRLVTGGFAGYRQLAAWLQDQGFEISHASVHRHGQALERQIAQVKAATDMAAALIDATPDDGAAMSDASLRLVQQKMFDLLLTSEDDDLKGMGTAATALAKAARANLAVQSERRKLLKDAAERQEKAIKELGIDGDTADALRRALAE